MSTIYKKILDITDELGAVGKDKKNALQHFDYRSIDSVMNKLNPLLIKHGVLIYPTVESVVNDRFEVIKEDQYGKKIQVWSSTKAIMKYTFVDVESGDLFTVSALGEGMDTSDKSAYKAMSGAIKYALFHTLMIPTEDDPDKGVKPPEGNLPDEETKDPAVKLVQNTAKVKRLFALAKEVYPDIKSDEYKEQIKTYFKVSSFTLLDDAQLDQVITGLEKKKQ